MYTYPPLIAHDMVTLYYREPRGGQLFEGTVRWHGRQYPLSTARAQPVVPIDGKKHSDPTELHGN